MARKRASSTSTSRSGSTKKSPKRESPRCSWDWRYTIPVDLSIALLEQAFVEVKRWLNQYTKTYCFQLERGLSDPGNPQATERLHFQGRLSLKVKERLSTLIAKFPQSLKGTHWMITSSANMENNFYVMKEDSRVMGPWMDKDLYVPLQWRAPLVYTERPWQKSLSELLKLWSPRVIHCVLDKRGGIGKSTCIGLLMTRHGAVYIPSTMGTADKMMQSMYAQCPQENGLVVINLPRGITDAEQAEVAKATELGKDGIMYDWRNKFRLKVVDSPGVCVFMNKPSDAFIGACSLDRWKFYHINQDELVDITRAIVGSFVNRLKNKRKI